MAPKGKQTQTEEIQPSSSSRQWRAAAERNPQFRTEFAEFVAALRGPKLFTEDEDDESSPIITASEFAALRDRKLQTLFTTKKALCYNFFPSKEAENLFTTRRIQPQPFSLVEIRDVHATPAFQTLRKKLNCYEIGLGNVLLHMTFVMECVLRHLPFKQVEFLMGGGKVIVRLLDITEPTNPQWYPWNANMLLYMLNTSHFVLACPELIRNRKLKAGSTMNLCWDAKCATFCFKSSL